MKLFNNSTFYINNFYIGKYCNSMGSYLMIVDDQNEYNQLISYYQSASASLWVRFKIFLFEFILFYCNIALIICLFNYFNNEFLI